MNAVTPGYRDAFRRVRELQGEEGLTGLIKHGASYQLVSLAIAGKRTPRKPVSATTARKIVLRPGSRCAVCGTPIAAEGSNRAEIDHRIPRIRGGSNEDANLQALCTACNNAKSTQCPNCTLQCQTCGWAYPESYRPVNLRADIIRRLNTKARNANQDVNDLANALLDANLPG